MQSDSPGYRSARTMAGYEYSLRRLFRPPTTPLPLPDQLQLYRQRDLVPSHLYRLGTGLLGGCPPRRRVIDASMYVPPGGTPHSQLVQRSLDGQIEMTTGTIQSHGNMEGVPVGVHRSLSDSAMSPQKFTNEEYRQWIVERRRMRTGLESLGASEQWLLSKKRTPLEASLLNHLQRRGRAQERGEGGGKGDTAEGEGLKELPSLPTPDPYHPQDPRRPTGRRKGQLMKEVALLQQFLSRHRKRLVTLLLSADKARDRLISSGELIAILHKLRVPVTADTLEVVVCALQSANGTRDGKIDYKSVLTGNLQELVAAYLNKMEASVTESTENLDCTEGSVSESSRVQEEGEEGGEVQRCRAPSTMGGEVGRLADEYKEEALRQFTALNAYCKANGVLLSWELAERALLVPPDHTRKACLAGLRQPGLHLLSSHFADPPEPEDEAAESRCRREEFGWAYKELRGRGKSRVRRLSTGVARVKAKTDCWMTFEEFQKLTEHITSRPGFKYRYHGLPENNAFWPGALLDRLRLWLPTETLLDKPTSLYNVFQPVQQPKVYNPYSPMVEQRRSWPENESGYVQFGSQTRKRYHL